MIIRDKLNKLLQIDNYKVLSQLGKGGFGTVYHVKDISTDREYALKLLHNAFNISRIKKQFEILKILNSSDYFLKTYQSKKIVGSFYLLLEFSSNINLEKSVKTEILSESKACSIVSNIVESLRFLQKNEIIHGDVKAENILKKGERYFLIDFDVSKRGLLVKTLHIQGDDDFTAPEIYRGIKTSSSDIYSLGCTLYYMLTSEHIYGFTKESDFSQKMYAHLYAQQIPNSNISKKMFYLISRMTDKDYKKRATVDEIMEILNPDFRFLFVAYSDKAKEDRFESKFERYTFMAEDGVSYAQNIVGLMYEEGLEVQKDLGKALKWYRLAAQQGLAKAQFNLALCYKMAKGCEEDYVEAREIFIEATHQEHNRSFYHLADMYEKGLGVEVDMKKAHELYKQSALNGYKPAYKKL